MKALIVVPGLKRFLPYIKIYEQILSNYSIEYNIVEWNRNSEEYLESMNPFVYYSKNSYVKNVFKRGLLYIGYISFVKNIIKNNKYDFLIIATLAPSVALYPFIYKYKKNYIVDIRDYSILIDYIKPFVKKVLNDAAFTIISSRGFKKWIPSETNYIMHNISNLNNVIAANNYYYNPIIIGTIGFLRDYDENMKVISSISNKNDFKLIFAGTGQSLKKLQDYTSYIKANNVLFTGEYKKEEEANLYKRVHIVNIMMPRGKSSDSLVSNRFVNSLTFYRPVIVTEGSYQAELVNKYKLGIVVNDYTKLPFQIIDYFKTFNYNEFIESCDSLLTSWKEEQSDTINKIKLWIESIKK